MPTSPPPGPPQGGWTSPATARNRAPILEVLRRALPATGRVLEIASGAGEHAVHMAGALPGLSWQPTDADPLALASIGAWRDAAGVPNLLEPRVLDVTDPADWPEDAYEAVVCINMIHISPWVATEGLMEGAARVLTLNGLLYVYGPFREGGRHTAPSNAAFDASLKARDPAWGVRDLEEVRELAERQGLVLAERVEMPANNLSLLFRRD
jgi:SAM-dependent methyltransferase